MPSQMLGIPEFASQLRVSLKADTVLKKIRHEKLKIESKERRILKTVEKG